MKYLVGIYNKISDMYMNMWIFEYFKENTPSNGSQLV